MVSNASHARPAPLACVECRAKHLKCDGATPRCGRCAAEGVRCVYKPSRRGYGRRNGKTTDKDRQGKTPEPLAPLTPVSGSLASNNQAHDVFSPTVTNGYTSASEHSRQPSDSVLSTNAYIGYPLTPPSGGLQTVDSELLLKAYYMHFHPAHPILVPRQSFSQQRYPDYLHWTVFFAAQYYAPQHLGKSDIEEAVKIMLAPDKDDMTVCRVQALIIYSIVLHSIHRPQEALECIGRAVQLADAIGLSRPDFASSNATPTSVQEESIRRTWWELYIIEGYLAALHRRPSLLSKTGSFYPPLPGPEELYAAGACDPKPPSLAMFENRAFANDSERSQYSSHCYRIEGIRIIHRVLDLFGHDHSQPDDVHAVDNAIASWKYYLPRENSDVADGLGDTDPLLFQAHYFVHSASILLHFPRSNLPATVPSAADIACVKDHTQRIPSISQHTTKAIAASKEICNLAASLSSTNYCSPLFICALILACIVQLADMWNLYADMETAGTIHRNSHDGAYLPRYRDRIVLLLGVLTEMGRRWTVAHKALQPLKVIAETVFSSNTPDTTISTHTSTQDGTASVKDMQSGIPWFDLFSMDDLMADFMTSEPGASFSDPNDGGL